MVEIASGCPISLLLGFAGLIGQPFAVGFTEVPQTESY
jgi:hypothetical protein